MSNGHLPAGSPAMPGGGHGAAQPAYNMGGSPVPNGGRVLFPGSGHQQRGRGRAQYHPAQAQNYYQQHSSPYANSMPLYGPYQQHGLSNHYGYHPQPYASMGSPYPTHNGAVPAGYAYQPPHQQFSYHQQPMSGPAHVWPHFPLSQSPSINAPYPSLHPFAPVPPSDVAPGPASAPPPPPPAPTPSARPAPTPAPPQPTTPASSHSHSLPAVSTPSLQRTNEIITQKPPSHAHNFDEEATQNLPDLPAPNPTSSPAPSAPSTTDAPDLLPARSPPLEPAPARIWNNLPWSTHPGRDWPKITRQKRKRRLLPACGAAAAVQPAAQCASLDPPVAASPQTPVSSEKQAPETPDADAVPGPKPIEENESAISRAIDASTTSTSTSAAPGPPTAPSPKTTCVLVSTQPPKTTVRSAPAPVLPILPVLPRNGGGGSPAVHREEPANEKSEKSKSSLQTSEKPKQEERALPTTTAMSWAAVAKGPLVSKSTATGQPEANGTVMGNKRAPAASGVATAPKPGTASLAEILKTFEVGSNDRIDFIEPRGLKNTGADCYMNSVLQLLLFCAPFYNFLDHVRRKLTHSFKTTSKTPLINVMIEFISAFRSITSADTLDQLWMKLKAEDYQLMGEEFAPNAVYDVIRELPLFTSVKPGSQHDAPEFLMLLLNGLEEECEKLIKHSDAIAPASGSALPQEQHAANRNTDTFNAWIEVGQGQRHAVSQRSGPLTVPNPISKIFFGQLRSELRYSRSRESVQTHAYQNLPLDIDDPSIRTVIDALKQSTRPEMVKSKNSQDIEVNSTKQTLIDTFPPILIMHLKRFDYTTGTAKKIWKAVGYPLVFEVPQEVLSRQARNMIMAGGRGLPKYKLTGVVYHHGQNVTSGHYTVDVLRQDGHEWIRFNDTKISPVSGEAVAEAGSEAGQSPKPGTTTIKHEGCNDSSGNRSAAIGDLNPAENGRDWKQVGSGTNGTKKHSVVVNGSSSGTSTPRSKPVRDYKDNNKVAYLLFYQLY